MTPIVIKSMYYFTLMSLNYSKEKKKVLSTSNTSTGYSMKQLFNRLPICSSIFLVVI